MLFLVISITSALVFTESLRGMPGYSVQTGAGYSEETDVIEKALSGGGDRKQQGG